MSSIPLALIQALTRRPRATAPSVDVTLPDDGGFTDAATVERNLGRVGSQPFVPTDRVGSGMYRPMETPPERAGRMVHDLPQGNGDDNASDPWLRQAVRPRVAALPEGTVTDLPDSNTFTRSVPPATDDLQVNNLAFRPEMERSTIDIGEGLNSADPRQLRAAMELRRDTEADKHRGFWGKVGRTIKGVGEGAY